MADPLWIFGYGSLLWRAEFPWVERRRASLRGFARRFWQGSTDHRERGGYERLDIALDLSGDPANGVTYVATPGNRNYLGPAPLEEVATQVRAARGPSGDNREYVVRLAASLREMRQEDPHVFELEQLLLLD